MGEGCAGTGGLARFRDAKPQPAIREEIFGSHLVGLGEDVIAERTLGEVLKCESLHAYKAHFGSWLDGLHAVTVRTRF
jgi:hypothetical protein